MFKPLLQQRQAKPHVDDVQPDDAWDGGLPETEQAAEARAAALQAREDEAAYRVIALRDEAGGVDAGDVLHFVHPVEVHACVEADLCPLAASSSQQPAAEHNARRLHLPSRS